MIEKYVDTAELRRLLSTLVVVLGGLIIAGLFASIVVPGLRNANHPATPTAVRPVVGESGWLDPTEFPPEKGKVIPPVDPKTLMTASPELLARGETLFENNCTSCHGPKGHGDGPAASTMSPLPRNFSSPDGWANGYTLPGIFRTVSEGVAGTSMAAFDYLSRADRMALVHYVQFLGSFPHGAGSRQDMDALAQQLATTGETTPNKIPVSMAMIKLEEEFIRTPPLVNGKDDQSPGAELLRAVVWDPARASQFLAESPLWRTGYRELALSVARETPANGFVVRSAALSTAEWQRLHSELLKRKPKKN
jgi:mono/diheme cytochrome c family protein